MGMYFPGFDKAMDRIDTLDEAWLYRILDALYGRDGLPGDPTIDDLRIEAKRQTREEFKDMSDPRWEEVDFWSRVHRERPTG